MHETECLPIWLCVCSINVVDVVLKMHCLSPMSGLWMGGGETAVDNSGIG